MLRRQWSVMNTVPARFQILDMEVNGTITYCGEAAITTVKSFTVLAPGEQKLFHDIAD